MNMGFTHKMQRCHEYVEALEEEKRKIQVFQRELPLCLELVTQAIEACKKELSGTTMTTTEYMQGGQSECSEQTSSDAPVLEEFIPLKRTFSSDQDNDEQHSHKPTTTTTTTTSDKKKSDWLRSVQLWNQTPDPPPKEDVPRKATVVEVKRNGNGGAFHPFLREKSVGKSTDQSAGKPDSAVVPTAATSSTTETVSKGSKREDKDGQSSSAQRKQRRCWSPELHRRFLHALQQLGGSHGTSTPKQIRELMKVDGLTNDEVKSHLQKYRLHTRRPSPTIHNNANPQAPQFVVVGGIWVPPPEYAAVTAKSSGESAGVNGIFAPMAAPPPQRAQSDHLQSEEGRGSHSEGGRHSSSPATSSSTHTTTTSPAM
ncbi:hypothetical protein Ddye_030648 [Dipteronia dyeriana]|uniref:HTH myb-type domain-containing protein n=1 Tax=Dipteronia dyeriana TaxID=168575 RepID=A0AAD9THG3_9ROSI|nr:hypothetical protein Ddye_030648 [Dipteronia dyeriana]